MMNALWRIFGKFWALRSNERKIIGVGLSTEKFERRMPAPQNAVDIFANRWASDLSDLIPGIKSGQVRHFTSDPRPIFAFNRLTPEIAKRGARILELGPLEGGHTCQFERLGAAEIIAIESNVEAYLKCLIAKELIGLQRAQFLLGDVVEYLRNDTARYDLIFCCGILYHMVDPVELVRLMGEHTDLISVWTHYYTTESNRDLTAETVMRDGERYTYHRVNYAGSMECGTFWGGNQPTASLLSRDDFFRVFHRQGFIHSEIHNEEIDHPNGPCINVTFWR